MKIKSYWSDVNDSRWDTLAKYFSPKAVIGWPNTGESFTPEEFVRVYRDCPGGRDISIVQIEQNNSVAVTVALVKQRDGGTSFYVTSFFEFEDMLITRLTEYWGVNGSAPEWRKPVVDT